MINIESICENCGKKDGCQEYEQVRKAKELYFVKGCERFIRMAKMIFDEEGFLEEPCLSCDKSYIEDIWHEWCCDEKECPYKAENKEQTK